MPRLFTLLLVLAFFSCTTENKNDNSTSSIDIPEGAVIEKQLKSYYADMSKRDWNKYRSYFWNNATITTAWKQPGDSIVEVDVTTIDDFIKETPQGPDSQPVFEETMKDSRIYVQGNMAEAWVEYDAKFGKQDSLSRWSGTDLFTFLRSNGEWKIVSLVFESKE